MIQKIPDLDGKQTLFLAEETELPHTCEMDNRDYGSTT